MATWEYISRRRGYVLEDFVRGASTLEQALKIFGERDVPVPQDGSLEALFPEVTKDQWGISSATEVEKPEVADSEPVVSETEEPEVADSEPVATKKKPSKKTKDKKKKSEKDWGIIASKESDG